MKRFVKQVLASLDIEITRPSYLGHLRQQIATLADQSVRQRQQIATLADQSAESTQRALNLETEIRTLMQTNGKLREENRALASTIHALRRQVELTNRSRPAIFVILSTLSQVPQFKAFVGIEVLAKTCDLVVVAYLDVQNSPLPEFCSAHAIALLDHNCLIVSCPDGLKEVLTIEPGVAPFFGADILLDDCEGKDRDWLEQTNKLLGEIHWQNSMALQADSLFRRVRPSATVLFEDNAEYHTGIWVAVSGRHGIPSVVFPYAIIDKADAAEARYDNPRMWADEGPVNRFVQKALPRWAFSYRERTLLRRLAIGALSSELLGFAQPQPWVWNSTRADVLAVESEAMRDVYLSQGIPAHQIQVTGSVADDQLYRAMRNKNAICRELQVDPDRPILVCGFPPDQLNVDRPGPEFDNFRTIVERWLGEFAKLTDWQVVLKPHPAMRETDVALLREFGFPITSLDTTSLIAVCDLFSTSVSSTIRWALACGKPTINYDVYRYRYRDFVDEPAVVTVCDFADFSRELARLTGESAALQELTDKARQAAARWGKLDGHSSERMLSLIAQLVDRSAAAPPLQSKT